MFKILNSIESPRDLKNLNHDDLALLAAETRELIIDVISRTGGHLAASLGAVEIAIALHYCLNAPEDKIVWDVGHQAYAHKILTGRRDRFKTIRQPGGISGFPNIYESEYDPFTVGHGSTSISLALGLAKARDLSGQKHKVAAVIGDGSLVGGMALEALNYVGHNKTDILIVLNDNEMSIVRSVGAFSKYLNRILTNPTYNKIHRDLEGLAKRVPWYGFRVYRAARKLEESVKNLLIPGMLFEELGIRYVGPVDGNNIVELVTTLNNILTFDGPILMHAITKKGKGYIYAEKHPERFHGTAPFEISTGELKEFAKGAEPSFTEAFSEAIVEIGKDSKIAAITAAMPEGTGLEEFSEIYPERFFNVGMAEQHAVTFAGGLARGGLIPIVAIYSTFLQRSYDQIIHDICLQGLHVVLCLDRAGIVGEDGPTHHGLFDIAYLRHMPNMTIMAPKDQAEFKDMLKMAVSDCKGAVAIRYPRGKLTAKPSVIRFSSPLRYAKSEVLLKGADVAILAAGSMVWSSYLAAELLAKDGIKAALINARFLKPLDENLLREFSSGIKKFVTVEEGVLDGGFGSAVLEFFEKEAVKDVQVSRIGLPDKFIEHGKRDGLFKIYGLDAEGIAGRVRKIFFPAGFQKVI